MSDDTALEPAHIDTPPQPLRLPLRLTVTRVRKLPDGHIHADCLVTDALAQSVQSLPLTMGPMTTPAEVYAILQNSVDQIARAMHKRGEVRDAVEPSVEADFNALTGHTFYGAVAS